MLKVIVTEETCDVFTDYPKELGLQDVFDLFQKGIKTIEIEETEYSFDEFKSKYNIKVTK